MLDTLLAILEFLLGLLDAGMIIADIVAFFRGGENRRERRLARRTGRQVPPRDHWNRKVIVLTIFIIVITATLVLWKA